MASKRLEIDIGNKKISLFKLSTANVQCRILKLADGAYIWSGKELSTLCFSNKEDPKMLQQAFEFQKTLCDSTFTIAASVQENCENIMKDMLDLYPWLPAQGKKACLDCSEQYWLGLNKCRKASLSGIDYLEQLVTPPIKAKEKTESKTTKDKTTPAKAKTQPGTSSTATETAAQ